MSADQSATPPDPDRSPASPATTPKASRFPAWAVTICVLLFAAGLYVLVYGSWSEWESGRSVQSTDDAYVRADVTALGTKASGVLAHMDVAEYEHVNAGQLIASIHDEDYKAQVAGAQAGLEAAEAGTVELQQQEEGADAKIGQVMAGITAAEGQIAAAQAGIAAVESTIKGAKAALISAQAQLKNATEEDQRQSGLYSSKATTLQKLQNQQAQTAAANASHQSRESDVVIAEAQFQARSADLKRAQANLQANKADLGEAQSSRRLLTAKENQVHAEINARLAALASAKSTLGYTIIAAPAAGYIASRNVLPGQFVSPGTTVVSLVEEGPWIQANFKETQLTRMAPGDVAEVRLDSFPSRTWKGHVLLVAPASGAQTALLPPDNATGNFTKVVQRIPVKIRFESNQNLEALRPGMSATVRVSVGAKG